MYITLANYMESVYIVVCVFTFCAKIILIEMDPCKINNAGCSQLCVNDNGRSECQCYEGYSLSADGKSCQGK